MLLRLSRWTVIWRSTPPLLVGIWVMNAGRPSTVVSLRPPGAMLPVASFSTLRTGSAVLSAPCRVSKTGVLGADEQQGLVEEASAMPCRGAG